ncbi:MAG: cell division protein FtsZ [Chitinophagaceae bacterium]|nr:cell division protein FtsZ [Chitinophagaceae bacterium]
MIHFDLPKEKSSIIKVIGVGGGGGNAVNHMFSQEIEGVNFIICNTDAQALANSGIPNRVQLGPHLTQGLGAGANPEIGRQATEESLEEIKRILEVNTKMAFITAGMGGGTGTGGAPIIAKICKDLGILTVGIVTTPFTYEGRKRQLQAEEGIKNLKNYVDTLLVISNDKLRHQFGNLKMREAFERADNVLATAAKCITDVINSTGQINVDFADVCTVMRNGGVAILGSAAVAGENRAHKAIEEALNSPLLNDNDIRGAKWILININSAEGDNEFTMDEVEVIQSYLLSRAGEGTDVIMGLGYDSTLGDKIGITLIATGFEYKDPFDETQVKKAVVPDAEEKIVMTLGEPEKKAEIVEAPVQHTQAKQESILPDALAPRLVEELPVADSPMPVASDVYHTEHIREEEPIMLFSLQQEKTDTDAAVPVNNTPANAENHTEKLWLKSTDDVVNSEAKPSSANSSQQPVSPSPFRETAEDKNPTSQPVSQPKAPAAGGYLARPSNIYAEPKPEVTASKPTAEEPTSLPKVVAPADDENAAVQMQLVEREDIPAADMPLAHHAQQPLATTVEDPAMLDEADEQKRRAAERLHKLRNLSYNVNGADPNNEFETVPAYIRRNMELYNQGTVEQFYSNYEVRKDEKNQTQISTLNTFLDGQKPD